MQKGLSWGPRVHLPSKENVWSHHQCLFENVRKTKKDDGLRILKMRVWELFTHGEGISTPRVRHKGRQPSIECANMTSKLCIFLFLCFLCIFPFMFFTFLCLLSFFFLLFCAFLYFILFCGRQGCFPRSYVSSGAMRKSDLCSSFRTKRWLNCFFFIFFARFFLTEQKSFKVLDL